VKTKLRRFIFPFLALVLPFGLYLKTLAPTYIPIDSAEFAMCMKFWGVCHPPGFPLYVAIGHFFINIFPYGPVIFKANLFSAIFGSLTILFVYLTFIELKVSRSFALLIALLLGVNAVFWEFSLAADVFTFGTFLLSLSFYFLFVRLGFLSFFMLGLLSSHFYITIVLVPIYYWYLEGFKPNLKRGLIYIVFFISGFFPQVIMFFRMQQDPLINWGHSEGISGFWYFVRRQEFGSIFLLSNPALTFHLGKTWNHYYSYFLSLFGGFGVILPFLIPFAGFFGSFKDKKFLFLLFSFLILVFIQLFLLSTIDPSGENNPFQINKFYLISFIPFILLAGISIERVVFRFLGKEKLPATIFLGFLILIYLFSNFKVNDYSKNYFSRNMVLDALSTLPENSVAITVSHVFYFGGRYEQEVNDRFRNVTLLYFPNEKNRDGEKYHPEIFSRLGNSVFADKVRKNKSLGAAEEYILGVIAKNLDRKVYILQGTFEEGFFGFLKPYIRPYGLWWKVEPDLASESLTGEGRGLFKDLRNGGLAVDNLKLKQQKLDLLTYAVAYHSTAIFFGAEGKYDEAIDFLEKSRAINPGASANIQNEIDLLVKTKELEGMRQQFLASDEVDQLKILGNNYYTLQNFRECESVFGDVLAITKSAEVFNNLASCQASQGKAEDAKVNYKQALTIDPNFELAIKGLKVLE